MRRALIACALALAACDLGVGTAPPAVDNTGRAATLTPTNLPAFFDCLRRTDGTVVSAHRGGPAPGFAENALPTLANTAARAPAFLEVDIARTRDGELVLMHDDTVDRTTTGAGQIGSLRAEQFAALSLQDESGAILDAHPPTLRQALDWADGRAILELDVKRGVSYEDVVRGVEEAEAIGRVVFITYSIDGATRVARIAPNAMIYTTVENARDLDVLEQAGVDLSQVVAWMGTDRPDRALISALARRGVEARLGVFGDSRAFAPAARAGVRIVAVDDALAAVSELDSNDGARGYSALICVGASYGSDGSLWIVEG